MSINIVHKTLRKTLLSDPDLTNCLIRALPLIWIGTTPTYDGEWLKLTSTLGQYPAITTGHTFENKKSGGEGLISSAYVKVNIDSSTYMFFLEPYKGNYDNYQGLDTRDGAVHYARSRNGGAETTTELTGQDWTAETKFTIKHENDQTDVYFYIGDVEKAHHTTNISTQPYEICCAEPNAVVREVSLKYPPGIKLR